MRSLQTRLKDLILDRAAPPVSKRHAIYADAYWVRLRGSIAEDFEKTAELLGAEKFETLILEYLTATPSRSWTLSDASAQLPTFVTETTRWNTIPALRTTSEWDLLRVHSSLTVAEPITAPGSAAFRLNPSLRWLPVPGNELAALRTQLQITPLFAEATGENPILAVWQKKTSDTENTAEERLFVGRSAEVIRTLLQTPEAIEERLAALGYDETSTHQLFLTLAAQRILFA